MKKFLKVCTIVGISLTVVGASTAISALAMGAIWELPYHWDIGTIPELATEVKDRIVYGEYNEYTQDGEWPVYSFTDINKLKIDITSDHVNLIESSDDGQIHVTWSGNADRVELRAEENELTIRTPFRQHWPDQEDQERRIDIEIPAGYYFDEAEIDIDSGNLNAVELNARELELGVKSGSIKVTDGSAGKLYLECNSGKINFYGNSDGDVDAKCSNGLIELGLAGVPEHYDYELQCRSGSIVIQGEAYADIAGEKKILNNGSKKMELESRFGKIKVDFNETLE